jgi:beta-N-acetylhexosaminidase
LAALALAALACAGCGARDGGAQGGAAVSEAMAGTRAATAGAAATGAAADARAATAAQAPSEAPTAAPTEAPTAEPTVAPTVEPTAAPTAAPTEAPTAAPTEAPASDAARAAEILSGMTQDEKLYQLFFVAPEALTGAGAVTQAGPATEAALAARPVGGIIYFAANIEDPGQVRAMLANAQSFSRIPLFLGVDEEGGRVARVGRNEAMGVARVPAMGEVGATGDPQQARDAGGLIGGYLSALGFNVDLAPVADVVSGDASGTKIGDRAFGGGAERTAAMALEFMRGLREHGVAAMYKHFPGYGSTEADTHVGRSESARPREQYFAEDFVPFRAGIAEGVDFILVSHMSALGLDPSGAPSSLSPAVVGGVLRGDLGYGGVVITDALNMGAVTGAYAPGEAAVLALLAGCDMLLMPDDFGAAVDAVRDALASGRLPGSRLDESCARVLRAKLARGILA